VFTPVILATQEAESKRLRSQPSLGRLQDLSEKYPTPKRAGGVAQVPKCLPGSVRPQFKLQYLKKKKKYIILAIKN
jgi:hypothetical protein